MQENQVKHIYPTQHFNLSAAGEIAPLLIHLFHPASVVDYGCGTATFLNVFLEQGVEDILGIDGKWVERSRLLIPENNFKEADLEQRIRMDRKFDMVLCLEVAEHLSEQSADTFIDNLISLGDIIIFSAAISNQGGQNHINEQHFDYWITKFKQKDFVFYDIFRKHFWNNPKINWWYKQNMFLVMHKSINISQYSITIDKKMEIQEYVHPDLLAVHVNELKKLKQKLNNISQGKASVRLYMQLFKKKMFQVLVKR